MKDAVARRAVALGVVTVLAIGVAAYAQKLLSWRMRHADRALTSTVLTPLGPISRVDPRIG